MVQPGVIWWVSGVLVIFLARSSAPHLEDASFLALAALGLLHAAKAFWDSGRNTITSVGVYMLASAVFVYFPAFYTHFGFDLYDVSNGFAALSVASLSQIGMYAFAWQPHENARSWTPLAPQTHAVSSYGLVLGALLLAAGIVVGRIFELGSTSLAGAAAFTGVIFIAVSVLHSGRRPSFFRLILITAAFGVYVESMFSGGGRLVLGGLAIALAIAVSQRAHTRWVKMLSLLALPTGLIALAQNRSNLVASTRGAAETGLESVVSPFARFAQLIELAQNGDLPLAFGKTLAATAVIFIPRSIWPEKPVGFGAVLGDFFRPDLIGTGYSEAALFAGEWVFSIGLAGLLVMLPVTAWLISKAQGWQHASHSQSARTRHDLFARVATIIIAAGILDLFWGGTFLFAARGGQRLLILGIIYVLVAWHSRHKPIVQAPTKRSQRKVFAKQ